MLLGLPHRRLGRWCSRREQGGHHRQVGGRARRGEAQRVLRGHPAVVEVAQVGRRVGDLDVGARVVRRELGRTDGGVVGADPVAGAAQGHRQHLLDDDEESGSAAAAARQ